MGYVLDDKSKEQHYLIKYGFSWDNSPVAGNVPAFERGFSHNNGLEFAYVAINLACKTVSIYNEYDCGGLLWQQDDIIPDNIDTDDEKEFITWLDAYVTDTLDNHF